MTNLKAFAPALRPPPLALALDLDLNLNFLATMC